MAKRKTPSKVPMADLGQWREWLEEVERNAFLNFQGSFDELERALGALRLAPHLGWKPLVVIHSKATIAKYEQTLGIEFRKEFEPEGPSALRSVGYGLARKVSNFWKAVSGEDRAVDRESRKSMS
jgi:hypothetical protein